jgi:formylglycine-generating enzyme required for sulfatase activity
MRSALIAIVALAEFAHTTSAQSCVADLNGDRMVNGADLGALLGAWGECRGCTQDLNGDGQINGADLGILLAAWGNCPVTVPAWATLVEALPSSTVVTDPVLRQQITATGLAWRVRDTATQVEMMLIPPGTFQMGCIMGSNQYGCHSSTLPVHAVTLTRAFYLGRYELTQAQWTAKMGSNPSWFQGQSDSAARPVESVWWTAVQGYLGATGFRLPTEAEWEYACRAGTQTPFYNGSQDDNTLGNLAWYSLNSGGQTHAVGGKQANGFGLYDMLGNVWEWVNDWYGTYPSTAQTDPTGPASALYRVVRGGSWYYPSGSARSSNRTPGTPNYQVQNVGFRVARNP